MSTALLVLDGVHKGFGALRVLQGVSLSLLAGERHAIIGPNGAGKTTLVNVVSGLLPADAGKIVLAGSDITRAKPERRVALGLVRTFQINSLFPNLTVAEHIALALSAAQGLDARPFGQLPEHRGFLERVAEHLDSLNLLPMAGIPVRRLAYGQRRLIELALAFALSPKVLLLDEPAAGLSASDRAVLLETLLRLPRSMAVAVIEHDMSLVFRFADRITVLVDGQVLVDGAPAAVRADPRVRSVYLGTREHV